MTDRSADRRARRLELCQNGGARLAHTRGGLRRGALVLAALILAALVLAALAAWSRGSGSSSIRPRTALCPSTKFSLEAEQANDLYGNVEITVVTVHFDYPGRSVCIETGYRRADGTEVTGEFAFDFRRADLIIQNSPNGAPRHDLGRLSNYPAYDVTLPSDVTLCDESQQWVVKIFNVDSKDDVLVSTPLREACK